MQNYLCTQLFWVVKTHWLTLKKIPLFMRLFIIMFLFAVGVMRAADSYSQNVLLDIEVQNQTIEKVLGEIEKQSEFTFFYNDKQINVNRLVSVTVTKETIFKVLDKIFKDTGISYSILDKSIILSNRKENINVGLENKKINGTVFDAKGEPIIGANVRVKGSTLGTITDLDGVFSLDVPENAILEVSYIGYESQTVHVADKTQFSFILKEDTEVLEDVVVIGYGSVKKSNLTGAVASVKMEEVPQTATTEVSNLLIGRVPGLSIRQNSAAPDGDYKMVIRGSASTNAENIPLYVIDGFPGGDINAVNPNDIESIEVLKDASSTSIYGARAANGVILVTTKRGKQGKVNINFKANASFQTMANPYDMMDAKEYMQMSNVFFIEDWKYNNKIYPYGNVDPNTVTSKPKIAFTDDQLKNARNVTDWFDEVTRTGIINNESLSINGGSDNSRYLLSLGHFGQKGVVYNSGSEKFMGRLSMEVDLAKWLTTGMSVSGTQISNDKLVSASSDSQAGVISDALLYPKYLSIFDDEGKYLINPDHPNHANPVSWKEITNETITNRYLINNFWNVTLTKELVFRMSWGVNSSFARTNQYYPKTMLTGYEANSKAYTKELRKNDYLLDATLTYTKDLFKGHTLKVMAGYAYQKFIEEYIEAGNSDFLTDAFGVNNLNAGGDLTKTVGSSKTVTKYLSYFGRINYDISDKYLFTFTLRADGSDRFGKDNRFGFFPSGAFAWRVIEEEFMKRQSVLSNLKLRLSIGQTGNAEIGGNTYGYYGTGYNYVFGNAVVNGVAEKQLANRKLKWETTTEWNVGLDFGFFNNRLTGSFEYFNKIVSDLLDKRNVGSYYPVSEVADNLGETQSSGVELQLSSVNIRTKDFQWSTDLNLSSYKDRWRKRNPYTILSVYNTTTDPLHVKWGYVSDGIIQIGENVPHMSDAAPGSIKIKDLNGWLKDANGDYILDKDGRKQLSGESDGMIDDADKVIICRETPDLSFGIGNTLNYKNWDLSFFFYGEIGRELYNNTRSQFLKAERFRYSDNVPTDARDRWSSTNPEGKYPSGLYTKYYNDTDFWVEPADFVRLKNITLGYTFPKKAFGGIFSNVRLFVDAQNLFCITNYTGADPETDNSYSSYPNQRTFSFGIDLTF